MIANAITYIFLALAVVVFIQPSASRFFAAAAFVSVTLAHEVLLSTYDGLLYYGSAALFDLAIIVLLSRLNPLPKMAVRLQRVCMVSIFVNAGGWVLWTTYAPPLAYDVAFAALYAWAIVVLTTRNGQNVGDSTLGRRHSGFYLRSGSWRNYSDYNKGEA